MSDNKTLESSATISYRFACPSDSAALGVLHYECATELEDSFMAGLGSRWLKTYYKAILSEPCTVVVAAFAESHRLLGFSSGSLDVSAQMRAVRKRRIALLLSALPALLRRPKLALGLIRRYRATRGSEQETFVVTSGCRADFLAWRKENRNGGGALPLLCVWYGVMRQLKCGPIVFEVDANNAKAERFHRLLGALVIRSFTTADGKHRLVMQYPNNSPRF
jgi:hypothetical protein